MRMLFMMSFLFSFSVFAQDSLTIVAVGEAENENEKIAFVEPKFNGAITAGEKSIARDMIKVFISDFSFYKHLFEAIENPVSIQPSMTQYSTWKTEGYRYVVESNMSKSQKGVILDTVVHDIQLEKVLTQIQSRVEVNNIRKFAHNTSNSIYKAITGNESIFNSKIVFVSDRTSNRKDTRKEIYIMDFDGERKQRLTYSNSMIISPSISPDNTKILYSIIESKWKKSSQGKIVKIKNINLYEMNLLNKNKRKISELDGINSGAIYTHDGGSIYLTLSHLKNADIYKMNLNTIR